MRGILSDIASPDQRVRLVLATRLVTIAGAPVTLLLVMTRVPVAEQGLYFVFVNLVALAQLFEIGVGSLVVQYASHELPNVRWESGGRIVADERVLRRVRLLLGRSVRWYTAAAVIIAVTAIPFGLILFSARSDSRGSAMTLWVLTVVATAAYLPMVPVVNTIEGCGRLVDVQRMRLVQAAALVMSAWMLIPTLGALIAVATGALLQLLTAGYWLLRRWPALLDLVRGARMQSTAETTPELDRLYSTQLRTAAVWLSAHLATQGLTPLVLYFHGAVSAGQIGATLALTTVPYTIGMSWLQGRLPDFGALASQGKHRELDMTARHATTQAAVVCLAGVVGVIAVIGAIHQFVPALRDRVLPPWPAAAALAAAAFVGLLLQAMAGYIRAYRAEPLVAVLIGGYAAMLSAAWVAASLRGPDTTAVAFFLTSALITLPATAFMLWRERRKLGVRVEVPTGDPA